MHTYTNRTEARAKTDAYHGETVRTTIERTGLPAGEEWLAGFVVWLMKDGAIRSRSEGANRVDFETFAQALAAAQGITATTGLSCIVNRYSKSVDGWSRGHAWANTEAIAPAR